MWYYCYDQRPSFLLFSVVVCIGNSTQQLSNREASYPQSDKVYQPWSCFPGIWTFKLHLLNWQPGFFDQCFLNTTGGMIHGRAEFIIHLSGLRQLLKLSWSQQCTIQGSDRLVYEKSGLTPLKLNFKTLKEEWRSIAS